MPPDPERKLSRHFKLGDLLVDSTFPELARQLDPGVEILGNLGRLTALMDQISDQFSTKLEVLSGYRDERLNDACREAGLPASVNSLHLSGCAADIRPTELEVDIEEIFDWVEKQAENLSVHEAVFYPKKEFIHVAVADPEKPTLRRILMRT
ncbi:MAG: D-Ala-D-Ala carboxypeptidase family metallohydrolase [Myxococcota bacterium]|nr:D-Ala-D-Ala carboxypeptidase family metallohydrolase [Myxococcota bacterium]